jgi:histidine triad (HIT) family protein
MSDTIFAKIIEGEIPAPRVYEDDHCIVINDIQPQAPVHMLVIPRKPIPRLVDASAEDQQLLGHLMLIARQMANEHGIGEGFRLIVNNGEGGGQTVFHLHLHVLGGTTLREGSMI